MIFLKKKKKRKNSDLNIQDIILAKTCWSRIKLATKISPGDAEDLGTLILPDIQPLWLMALYPPLCPPVRGE